MAKTQPQEFAKEVLLALIDIQVTVHQIRNYTARQISRESGISLPKVLAELKAAHKEELQKALKIALDNAGLPSP